MFLMTWCTKVKNTLIEWVQSSQSSQLSNRKTGSSRAIGFILKFFDFAIFKPKNHENKLEIYYNLILCLLNLLNMKN